MYAIHYTCGTLTLILSEPYPNSYNIHTSPCNQVLTNTSIIVHGFLLLVPGVPIIFSLASHVHRISGTNFVMNFIKIYKIGSGIMYLWLQHVAIHWFCTKECFLLDWCVLLLHTIIHRYYAFGQLWHWFLLSNNFNELCIRTPKQTACSDPIDLDIQGSTVFTHLK